MREIKFRVWDNVDYMSGPFTLEDILTRSIVFTPACPVMQYTGLNDKNGKEIYEGDILKTDSGALMTVSYRNDMAQFVCRFAKGASVSIEHAWEVVGNIYENPKLIK